MASHSPAIEDDRLTYTVDEVARLLGLSRPTAFKAVADGAIPSVRIGRRILVPRDALFRLLNQGGSGAAA